MSVLVHGPKQYYEVEQSVSASLGLPPSDILVSLYSHATWFAPTYTYYSLPLLTSLRHPCLPIMQPGFLASLCSPLSDALVSPTCTLIAPTYPPFQAQRFFFPSLCTFALFSPVLAPQSPLCFTSPNYCSLSFGAILLVIVRYLLTISSML